MVAGLSSSSPSSIIIIINQRRTINLRNFSSSNEHYSYYYYYYYLLLLLLDLFLSRSEIQHQHHQQQQQRRNKSRISSSLQCVLFVLRFDSVQSVIIIIVTVQRPFYASLPGEGTSSLIRLQYITIHITAQGCAWQEKVNTERCFFLRDGLGVVVVVEEVVVVVVVTRLSAPVTRWHTIDGACFCPSISVRLKYLR